MRTGLARVFLTLGTAHQRDHMRAGIASDLASEESYAAARTGDENLAIANRPVALEAVQRGQSRDRERRCLCEGNGIGELGKEAVRHREELGP